MERTRAIQHKPVRMHPLSLRFDDPEHERAFRDAHDGSSLTTVRLAGLVGAAMYMSFGVLDAAMVPDHFSDLLLVRLGVVLYIGLVVALTYHPIFPRAQQVLVCSALLVAAWGTIGMQFLAPVPDSFGAMGSMLILIFLYAFVRARVIPALVTSLLVAAGYAVTLLLIETEPLTAVYLNFELGGFVVAGLFACHTLERLWRRDYLRGRELQHERERAEALLHNVLPATIVQRLKTEPSAIADAADGVSVLFADISGFTPLTEVSDPHSLVSYMDRLFVGFDELCDRHGAEKIKTIGDGYMAVTSLPDPHPDAPGGIAELALGMREVAAQTRAHGIGPLDLRIGVCSGPVIAGVIGNRKFAYDLWGDTVNTASRLEAHGAAGAIHVCDTTRRLLGDRYAFSGPDRVDLKGKGPTTRWELLGAAGPRERAAPAGIGVP